MHWPMRMNNKVNTTNAPINKFPVTDWQIQGELELPVGSNTDDTLNTRLTEILKPTNLPAEFLSRILKSAQDSTARILQIETMQRYEHIHLLIFIKNDQKSKGQAWGFFRVEKVDNSTATIAPNHAIEFYLYPEG